MGKRIADEHPDLPSDPANPHDGPVNGHGLVVTFRCSPGEEIAPERVGVAERPRQTVDRVQEASIEQLASVLPFTCHKLDHIRGIGAAHEWML
jgi:hypothetical protein